MITTSTTVTGSDGSPVVIKQEPADNCSQTVDNHSTNGYDVHERDSSDIGNATDHCQNQAVLSVKQEYDDKECDVHEIPTASSEGCDQNSKMTDVPHSKIERCVSLNTDNSQCDDTASELMEVSGEIDYEANIMDGIDGMPKDARAQTDEERGRTACHQSDDLGNSKNIERKG